MADKKITDLPLLAKANTGDYVPVVDSTTNTTKKVPVQHVVPDASVTPEKRSGGFKLVVTELSGTGIKNVSGAGFAPKAVIAMPLKSSSTVDGMMGLTMYDGSTGVNQRMGARTQATSGAYSRTESSTVGGLIVGGSFVSGDESATFVGRITGLSSNGCTVNVSANSSGVGTTAFLFLG
ncbi:hypothetical protein [Tsukamurella spumae]|uniref:hypothetical protein n=1 Tax=Tsukamurella spumae TaxID=44753 RepID=UPI0031D4130B